MPRKAQPIERIVEPPISQWVGGPMQLITQGKPLRLWVVAEGRGLVISAEPPAKDAVFFGWLCSLTIGPTGEPLEIEYSRGSFQAKGAMERKREMSVALPNPVEGAPSQAIVTIRKVKSLLGSQEAASLLGITQRYLYELIDRRKLPFQRKGNRYLFRVSDLYRYRER